MLKTLYHTLIFFLIFDLITAEDEEAVIVENPATKADVQTRLFTGNQQLDAGVAGLAIGVGGALLVGHLLNENDQKRRRCRVRRDTDSDVQTRFLPGLTGNNKNQYCPPGYVPVQPHGAYQQPPYQSPPPQYPHHPQPGYPQPHHRPTGYPPRPVGYPHNQYATPYAAPPPAAAPYTPPRPQYPAVHKPQYPVHKPQYPVHKPQYPVSPYKQSGNGYQQAPIYTPTPSYPSSSTPHHSGFQGIRHSEDNVDFGLEPRRANRAQKSSSSSTADLLNGDETSAVRFE